MIRTSAVVKRQFTRTAWSLRARCHAAISRAKCSRLSIRSSRHWRASTESSNSAKLEPTAMLRGVVDLELVSQAARFGRREGRVEAGHPVGVELVHHHHQPLGSCG